MANNHVQLSDGTTIIDIRDTTATEADVAEGKMFYKKSGERATGTGAGGGSDVFVATYGTTTYLEIAQAVSAGKVVMLETSFDKRYCVAMPYIDTNVAYLYCAISRPIDMTTGLIIYRCNKNDNAWSAVANQTLATTGALSGKADLVPNAVSNEILITDANGQPQCSGTDLTQLLFDVDAGKNAIMLKDFNQSINVTIPSVLNDIPNTSIPNVDISITSEEAQTWAIASLMKYEVFDSSNARLNAFQVCSFSMNQQATLRIRMMVAGPNSKTAAKIQGALLLKHR